MDTTQQILFNVGAGKYGFDVNCVEGIEITGRITPTPEAYGCIIGIIKVRDGIYPVYSLRDKLGIGNEKCDSEMNKVILVRGNGTCVAFKVDEVSEIITFDDRDLHDTPQVLKKGAIPYVKCIASLNEKLVMLLDENNILSFDELESVDNLKSAS